jgi:hypothetical protein
MLCGRLRHHFNLSTKYGFGVLGTTLKFVLQKRGLVHAAMFSNTERKIADPEAS